MKTTNQKFTWLMCCSLSLLTILETRTSAAGSPALPLRVSDNGRSLVNQSGQPVFLLCDTAWSLAVRVNRSDAESYLRLRQAQGFNAVTFVLFTPGNADLADGLTNCFGHAPFKTPGGQPDPAQPELKPGPDNDFWDHVDWLIALTRRMGIYSLALPTWGHGVTGGYNGKEKEKAVFNEANARVYGRWLGERYKDQSHVIWMLGGDVAGAYPNGHDYTPVFRAMAKGLEEGIGGERRFLMSFHPQKPNPRSGAWFQADAWLSFNSIQAWPEDQIKCITADWEAAPVKPTWIFEGRYEAYWKKPYQAEQWGEWQCRQQAWQTVFAGAFGHTYGHERVFGFGKDGWDWRKELDAPGVKCMTHLASFMASLDPALLLNRVPDQSLLDVPEGKAERLKSDRITATRQADGSQALFYSASGRTIRVKLGKLAAGKMSAAWFNPRKGVWVVGEGESNSRPSLTANITTGPGAGAQEFDAPGKPGDGNDWVLVLGKSR